MGRAKSSANLIGKISTYLQIVSTDPHSTAFVPLAEAYRQLGLLGDALEAARMGTGMLPNFSPGFTTLGRVLAQMGRIEEALSAFAKALAIDPQSHSALVSLARLHLARGDRDQARTVLRQAAQFHRADEVIDSMLVAIDMPSPWRQHPVVPLVAAAPVDAERAAAVEPLINIPIPTATLAEIYAQQGLTDQAAHVYEELLRAEPGNASMARRLAELRGHTLETPPMPAAAAAETTPPPAAPAATRIVEVFEGWLRAIQARRAHVQ